MENNVVSFDSKTLKTALKIVSKAADTDQQPQRYALRCILVEVNPDGVNLIATNGKVMHICEFSTVHLSKNPFGITGQWLLTMEAWKAILATSTTKINRIDLVFNNQVLTHTDGSEEKNDSIDVVFRSKEKIESKLHCCDNSRFPNWRMVVPCDTPSIEIHGDTKNFYLWYDLVTRRTKKKITFGERGEVSVACWTEVGDVGVPHLEIKNRTQYQVSFDPDILETFRESLPERSSLSLSAHDNAMYKVTSGKFTCVFKGYD